jgi:hypothetical protein
MGSGRESSLRSCNLCLRSRMVSRITCHVWSGKLHAPTQNESPAWCEDLNPRPTKIMNKGCIRFSEWNPVNFHTSLLGGSSHFVSRLQPQLYDVIRGLTCLPHIFYWAYFFAQAEPVIIARRSRPNTEVNGTTNCPKLPGLAWI